LKSKTENDYEAYFTIEMNGEYVNLKKEKFVGNRKKIKENYLNENKFLR
jgi:hypothetical protein